MTDLLFIRVETGLKLGIGHLMRCLALMEQADRDGWRIVVASSQPLPKVSQPLLREVEWLQLPVTESEQDDARFCRNWVERQREVDHYKVVVDHYRFGPYWENCWPNADDLLVIDDLKRTHRPDCWLLDYHPRREARDYPNHRPDRLLLGAGYMLLRQEFVLADMAEREPYYDWLVTFGGTDPQGYGEQVVRCFYSDSRARGRLGWLGASPVVAAALCRPGLTVEAIPYSTSIARLYTQSRMVLGAAGVSAWEQLALKVPMIIWQTADNQKDNVAVLKVSRGVFCVSNSPNFSDVWMGRAVRMNTAIVGRENQPGNDSINLNLNGAARVWSTILSEGLKPSDQIKAHRYCGAHIDSLFELQSIPGVRRWSRNPQAPTYSEHLEWSQRLLRDTRSRGWLFTYRSKSVGWLKLDENEDGSEEISILVHPRYQGLGFGKKMLEWAKQVSTHGRLVAEVNPANEASRMLFRSNGFSAHGTGYVWHPSQKTIHRRVC